MKYEKPEIASVHSALVVVQGGMKGSTLQYDNVPLQTTPGAYEADE